jgi:hypothetical protein
VVVVVVTVVVVMVLLLLLLLLPRLLLLLDEDWDILLAINILTILCYSVELLDAGSSRPSILRRYRQ